MEAGPAVLGAEVRRAVVSVGVGGVVAVVVAIGPAGEERGHRRRAEAGIDGGHVGTQLGVLHVVGGQARVGSRHEVVFRLPALLSQHGRHRVLLGEGVAVGQVVLELQELA